MTNRVTLAQLRSMGSWEVESLPADMLAMLLEDVAALKADAKALDDKLNKALESKYGATAQYKRKAAGKDTGTVHIEEGGVSIIADLPKRVKWDGEGLRKVAQELRALGESVEEYIKIEYDVDERKFTAWPSGLREMFTPHRTVGVGKATYKISKKVAA
jgi:hypothetical protein